MGDTDGAGTEGRSGKPGDDGARRASAERAGGDALGLWRDCDWLPCADGVWRPVEPGTFPLVDGTAFRLGSGSPFEGQRRAALICGYGDAIVPQLGARFLLAAEEAILQERIRRCAWCGEPIPPGKRKDAETCSTACRQKRWRFRVAPAPAGANGTPLRLGYADPPYPGLAQRYYQCAEVDHAELIARLMRDYPHGWALSTSRDALRGAFPDSGAPDGVLALCPPDVRVCVWVKPHRSVRSRWPHNDWEPLIVYGGRPRLEGVAPDLCDVLVWGGRQHSHPKALVGMKPAAFCEWMFRQLGAQAGDTLDDLFPGSGAVGRAWALYTSGPGSPDASDGAASDASHLEARRVPSRLQEAQASLRERLDAPARRDD